MQIPTCPAPKFLTFWAYSELHMISGQFGISLPLHSECGAASGAASSWYFISSLFRVVHSWGVSWIVVAEREEAEAVVLQKGMTQIVNGIGVAEKLVRLLFDVKSRQFLKRVWN